MKDAWQTDAWHEGRGRVGSRVSKPYRHTQQWPKRFDTPGGRRVWCQWDGKPRRLYVAVARGCKTAGHGVTIHDGITVSAVPATTDADGSVRRGRVDRRDGSDPGAN